MLRGAKICIYFFPKNILKKKYLKSFVDFQIKINKQLLLRRLKLKIKLKKRLTIIVNLVKPIISYKNERFNKKEYIFN